MFYYCYRVVSSFHKLNKTFGKHLNEEFSSQNICEGIISKQECEEALKAIKSNKSPGNDGLPIEFYRMFWSDTGSLLVDVYNESFENQILPLSMRKSVITLIHKKDDKCNIKKLQTNKSYQY